MSITKGSGPLSGRPGETNYTIQSPPHRILFEPDERRLRAFVGDRVVLDTTRARLLHETGIRPVAYVPLEDFDQTLLERSDTSTHCPFKGDASYWTLRAGDEPREDAVWGYEQPIDSARWLRGYGALAFDKADRWMVEDEPVVGHLRDPYHRIDVYPSSRRVTVTAGDDVIAASSRTKLMFETGEPVRPYFPRGDVTAGMLEPSHTRAADPYKGDATFWHVRAGGERHDDGAYGFEIPRSEAMKVAGHVCFAADGLTVRIEEATEEG